MPFEQLLAQTLRWLFALFALAGLNACTPAADAPPVSPTPTAIMAPPTPTIVVAPPTPAGTPQSGLPFIPLTINGHALQVELATTPAQRAQGLMFRTDLAENVGMLFVFPDDAPRSFWMQNTPLPLSIAFIDAEGRIVNIADMQPFDDRTLHPSDGPARYALEVNQGWFAQRGIGPGDRVEFQLPPDLEVS